MGNDGTSTKFKYLKKLTTSSPVISALLLNDNTLAINFQMKNCTFIIQLRLIVNIYLLRLG